MTLALIAVLLKLALGLAAFLLIAYVGTQDRRVAGVLLTFPILNGIAMITGADPLQVAEAIFPIVVFNSLLFCAAITFCTVLPPTARHWSSNRIVALRLATWIALWLPAALVLTAGFGGFFDVAYLVLFQAAGALLVLAFGRSGPASAAAPLWRKPLGQHGRDFLAFWWPPGRCQRMDAAKRIAAFLIVFSILLAVAALSTSDWVGAASGIPLPGLFALATLSVLQPPRELHSLRDTVMIGPLLAIAFNLLLARLVTGWLVLDLAIMLGLWAACAVLAVVGTTVLARTLDRRPAG